MYAGNESGVALYQQVSDYLRHSIRAGALEPGAQIESESSLMKRFGVSRVTVRNAVADLVREGLLVRRQGKGTFVASPQVKYRLQELYGTTEVLASHGLQPQMRLLSRAVVVPEAHVAAALDLPPGERALRIQRLVLAGHTPFAMTTIYLPEDLGRALTTEELADQPLYHLLWYKCGVFADRASQTLRAVKASREVAGLLSVAQGDPVFFAERVTLSSEGRPVEYATLHYRSETISFSVEMQRSRPGQEMSPTVSVKAQLSKELLINQAGR